MWAILKLYSVSLKEILRDRATLVALLIFPLLFVGFLAFIDSSAKTTTYKIGIAGSSTSSVTNIIKDSLESTESLSVELGTQEQLSSKMKENELDLYILITEENSQKLTANQPSQINIYYDPSNQTSTQTEINLLDKIFAAINQNLTGQQPLLNPTYVSIKSTNFSEISYILPGILVMMLMQIGILSTAPYLVSLREKGVLRHIGVTPLPKWKFFLAQIFARLTIAAMQMTVIILFSALLLKIRPEANTLVVIAAVLLTTLLFISAGYLVAAIAKTVEGANQIATILFFAITFLSGAIVSITAFPESVRFIANLNPGSYVADMLRQLIIGGTPQYALATDVLVAFFGIVICGALSVKLFKWE